MAERHYIEEDLRLEQDIRAAFLRKKFPVPDVKALWHRFQSAHVGRPETPAGPKPVSPLRWMMRGFAAGLVVPLILGLLIWRLGKEDTITVFSATAQNQWVSLEEGPYTKTVNMPKHVEIQDNKRIEREETGKPIKEASLDMRGAKTQKNVSAIKERTVRTPRGKDFHITLSDGTEVRLNAESSLRFPSRFDGAERIVYLEGEAYFTVAKDAAHPFIVKSRNLSTMALGTEFNVTAYSDEERVVLINGSVRVAADGIPDDVTLEPGQAVSVLNNKLVIADANIKVYTQWKQGYFYFDNVPMIEVLLELGRWYNVNIELSSRKLMSYRLHFISDRNSSLCDIVEHLNHFSYLHAQLQGNTLRIEERE